MPRCFLFLLPLIASAAEPVRVFEAAKVDTIYRVVLDRGALLLESINGVIKEKGVTDGHVQVTAGSVSECSYHYVADAAQKPTDVVKTVKGAFEILNGGGIIANGEPHLHITLSGPKEGAFGGHLENGCKILYLGEVTIIKYSGQALTRKKNANGISLLQPK
jgi:predicted DNA-binding protein with PD1-like motif